MFDKLTLGNAATDSREFRQWLVGDIQSWTGGRLGPVDASRIGLRDTQDLEIKWGMHPAGEQRPGGWAAPSERRGISILISGQFVVTFRHPDDPDSTRKVRLAELGDYLIWDELYEHRWEAVEESLILTVRWDPGAGA